MDDQKQAECNAKALKLSLSRRSLSIRKKASELAVLCDASMCLMQFDQDGQLKTFPEDASEVNNVLKRYLSVGGKVSEKRKVSGLAFRGNKVKKPDPVLDDMHENNEGTPPSLRDELLDTESALELQNFKHVLDLKMKKLEERIRLLKGIKSPEKKQKAPTLLQFFQDGTTSNPDDLQLSFNFSGGEPFSKHDGIDLAASSPDPSFSHHHLGLAANNVADDSFCFSEQPSTDSSSCDSGIQKMDNEDGEHVSLENITAKDSMCQHHQTDDLGVEEGIDLPLKGNESAEKKRKPCSSDDLQMSICSSRSPFFHDYEGLAVYPTNLLLIPFQSIEAATNVAQGRFPYSKLPYSDGSSWDNGCEMDSAKEEHYGLEDTTAKNSTHLHQ